MAEAALLGVAKSVLGQLGKPALQELLLVWNSKKDLQRLEQTIQTITDFLHDAEQRESTSDLVRGWLSRLREVLYEADDLFDSVTFMALHKKAMSGSTLKDKVHRFSSKLKQPGFDLKVAHGVKDIRERLDGIKDDMSPFNFALIKPQVEGEESSVSVRLRNREETHSFVTLLSVLTSSSLLRSNREEEVGCIRSVGSSLFPCLETLRMEVLPNLKGWWRDLGDKAPMPQLPSLPRVSKVDIIDCPHLVENMPLFGGEIKVLTLSIVSTKLLNMSLSSTSTSKLQVLVLNNLKDLKCLPEGSIRRLTALKSLMITCCEELRWVSSRGLAYLTSLEKLMISSCGNVRLLDDERGCDGSEMTTMETMIPWASLQRLCKVEVPWQSHLLEGLQYLTSLEELTVQYDEDDNVDAHDEDLQGKLGLLERLHTLRVKFRGLQCNFPRWAQHLRCIKLLVLDAGSGSKELMNMSWASLAKMNLHSLRMLGISKVSRCSVDDWVAEQQQQLTSLVELFIDECTNDQSGGCTGDIPWKLLPCLRTLRLSGNMGWNLSSDEEYIGLGIQAIPDWMINLTSLQRLSIRGCSPELAKRCEKQTGEDWHLISHIPDIDIHAPYLPSITM